MNKKVLFTIMFLSLIIGVQFLFANSANAISE